MGQRGGFIRTPDIGKVIGTLAQIRQLQNQSRVSALEKLRSLRLQQQIEAEPEVALKRELDIIATQNKETRDQAKFSREQISELPELFARDFNLGNAALQSTIPGATATKSEDGTVTFNIPSVESKPDSTGRSVTRVPSTTSIKLNPLRASLEPKERFSQEKGLRGEFTKASKTFREQTDFLKKLGAASKKGTPQGDIAIVFAFMKILDPGSVVREGEQATARNAPGVPERILGLYNRLLTAKGPFFTQNSRDQFLDAAKDFVSASRSDILNQGVSLFKIANRSGLNPDNVILPVGDINLEEIRRAASEPSRFQDKEKKRLQRTEKKGEVKKSGDIIRDLLELQ